MSKAQDPIFDYFRKCYEIDTKTISLSNIFGRKVENRYIVEGKDEVLDGKLPYLPIPKKYFLDVSKNLETYSKEKTLFAFSHFIIGSYNGNRVCAPLFLIPCELIQERDYHYVKLNHSQKFLNANFLTQLKKDGAPSLDVVFEKVLKENLIGFGQVGQIERIFDEYFYDVDASGILMYPNLLTEKKIKSTRPRNNLKMVSSLGFGVVRQSSKTLGIISELKSLPSEPLSSVLHFILGNNKGRKKKNNREYNAPAILSSEQKRALKNADDYRCSVIIGPPGTGKSYTIANIALDQMKEGKSVLIVSKTDEAVNVVHEKVGELGFAKTAIRAGKSSYSKELKNRIQNILSTKYVPEKRGLYTIDTRLSNAIKSLSKTNNNFSKAIKAELNWGEYLFEAKGKEGPITNLRRKYIAWRNNMTLPHWELSKKYYKEQNGFIRINKEFLNTRYQHRLHDFLKVHRVDLANFLKGLRARTMNKRENLFSQIKFQSLLEALPIWLCNLSDLSAALPFYKELFDVVIIDEASQCDLASSLPALQRAKNVVVVGDPNQLRHFSFVSERQQANLREKLKVSKRYDSIVNYRNLSLLDVCFEACESNDQVTFLNEHFRGNEQLLSFSNDEFYENRLKMMKSLPSYQYKSVEFIECKGERSKVGINEIEVTAILQYIDQLIKDSEKLSVKPTVGLLSPFRKQTERIRELIEQKFDLETIESFKLMVGTPYEFQGNERDLMLISWAIDDNSHSSAKRYIDTPESFNVATTRAKVKQLNFRSFDIKSLNSDSLLRRYCSWMNNFEPNQGIDVEFFDGFLNEVKQVLDSKKISYFLDYSVASISVDILIEIKGVYKAIDLIGFPGQFYDSIDLNQYMLLNRAGISVFPLPYTYWYFDKEAVKKELLEYITN